MLQSNELKPGVTIEHENEIYVVLDFSQNKTARSAMVVKAKVRNLRTGSNVELSFGSGDKIKPAHIDKKAMQYLYDAGEGLMFMDNDTYEQVEVPKQKVEWEMNFLRENDNVTITMFGGEILGVMLPDKVSLKIIEAEPAVKGDTATNAQKNAVLETGYTIRVPLFIDQDEEILVSTGDGKYAGRA
ncbi:MAG: elongation factor P [Breznakia sp.]